MKKRKYLFFALTLIVVVSYSSFGYVDFILNEQAPIEYDDFETVHVG